MAQERRCYRWSDSRTASADLKARTGRLTEEPVLLSVAYDLCFCDGLLPTACTIPIAAPVLLPTLVRSRVEQGGSHWCELSRHDELTAGYTVRERRCCCCCCC